MSMKAIILHKTGKQGSFSYEETPIPVPRANEVRIRVKAAAFNPVDYKIAQGQYGLSPPLILGADCSGVINDVGEDVTNFAIGDEVYAFAFGQCSNGCYAEYLCLPQQFVARKPKKLSFEQAACVPLASLTAYRSMAVLKLLKAGGSIFIAGAGGGVGSFAVQLARQYYNNQIYTVARTSRTLEFLVDKLKIDRAKIVFCKDLSEEEVKNTLLRLNQGRLFSATFDFVGGKMKSVCTNLTDYSGHVVSVVPEPPSAEFSPWSAGNLYFQRNLSIHCVFVGAESFYANQESWGQYQEQLSLVAKLFEDDVLLPPFVQQIGGFNIDTVKQAHSLLKAGHVTGKLVMMVE